MTEKEKILERQKELNQKLAIFMKESGIKKVNLTSLGNSIASGYSMVRVTKPLLLRNETIQDTLNANDVDLEIHHFARAQNNNDEHIYEWLESNIKESEIHKLNRNDYSDGRTSMHTNGMTEEKLAEYYPIDMQIDKGLNDLIKESSADLANIVVYNGCTGSFLDGATRKGSLHQQLFYGVNRDTVGLESVLKKIQTENRLNKSNTQVYLCGAPNFLGLGITELINRKLKKIANKYANVVYVEPVNSKFFYKKLEDDNTDDLGTLQNIIKKHLRYPDIHYDEEEYLKFNNNIIESIINNYQITKSIINIDRKFYEFNKLIEIDHNELIEDNNRRKLLISEYFTEEYIKLPDTKSKELFLEKMRKYLIERYPYDFYYLEKDSLIDAVNNKKL